MTTITSGRREHPSLAAELPAERLFVDEAKLRILQAAESLFAERAIESVSLREIAVSAGHANTNAVQYHFGSREALVQAIFAWRVWQMEGPRGAGLARAEAEGKLDDLATLMRILCLPMVDLTDAKGRHTYAGFMSQHLLRQRPAGIRHAVDTRPDIAGNIRRVMSLIYDRLGGLSHIDGDYRMALAHLMFCNQLVLADSEGLPTRDPVTFRSYIETSLVMATAALKAGIEQ
jgi:TetR/AcrR family transcriptional regulator, regulator of cefoperazone and chloramphenicol sensitivity